MKDTQLLDLIHHTQHILHAVTVQKFPDVTHFGLVHDLSEDTKDVVKMCFMILVVVSGWW